MSRSSNHVSEPATNPCRRAVRSALTGAACVVFAVSLAACSSGGGGDGGQGGGGDVIGGGDGGGPSASAGLQFSYPVRDQRDVYAQSQIVLRFAGDASDRVDGLTLAADGDAVPTDVVQDEDQPNIVRLQVAQDDDTADLGRPALQPSTEYSIVSDGNTLLSFTTRPMAGSAAADGFEIVDRRGASGDPFPFLEFNTIRMTFSEPVDPGSVRLGDTFTVTDGTGTPVDGRLTALGRHLSFDPTDDLDSDDTYTVTLNSAAGSGVQSIYGRALNDGTATFSYTPVDVGNAVPQTLVIGPTSDNVDELPASGLNGGPANLARLVSNLVGENLLPAFNNDQRRALRTRLAGTTSGDRYNDTFPAVIPAGQQFDLGALNLKLGGGVATQVNSGNIQGRFLNDADVFIGANDLSAIETPTAVRLRFDLGIGADIENNDQQQILANGAFNQTVMNVVAAGLVVPQENGDLRITTLGSFPTAVNRNGEAITDFELELTLANPRAGGDVPTVQPDSTQPFITAQYPSACLYTYGSELNSFGDPVSYGTETVPLESAENDCARNTPPLSFGPRGIDQPAGISDFSLAQNPAITFSEPIDPRSLVNASGGYDESHLQLTDEAGNPVDFTAYTEGNSVVLDPEQPLAYNTEYTITLGDSLADLGGNTIRSGDRRTFLTAPYVRALPPQTYNFVDSNGNPGSASLNNVAQTAPFITAIQPGLPCALDPASGDFLSGGNTAGYCLGDDRSSSAPSAIFPVFELPANNSIKAQFTKPVKTESIQLADACLTGNGGAGGGSIAVQRMNGADCDGVVPGTIVLPQADEALARSFQFVPDEPWQDGQRYWLVICGDQQDQCSASANTIVGRDDGQGVKYVNTNGDVVNADYSGNLNTNPLQGTGSQASTTIGDADFPDDAANGNNGLVSGFRRAGGGPDIVMPFNGAPATRNYSFFANALPLVDVNGNGVFDGNLNPNIPASIAIPDNIQPQFERPIAANGQYLNIDNQQINFAPNQVVYQSGAVPNTVLPLSTNCAPAAAITGTTPAQCVPVTLAPGGLFQLSALNFGRQQARQAGRILLRVAGSQKTGGVGEQTGYIVPKCSGTIDTGDDLYGGEREYSYSPCFVLGLDLIASGPDGQSTQPFINISVNQQPVHLDLVGQVSFERNGRLVLSLTNTNQAVLDDNDFLFVAPSPLTIRLEPGHSNIQLAGPAIHGGALFKD